MKKIIKKMNKNGIFSIILFLFICLSMRYIKPVPAFPKFGKILESALSILKTDTLKENALYSIRITFIAISISFTFGILIASLCWISDFINDLLSPIFNFIKNIPALALFPLFIALFGIDDEPRIAVVVWTGFSPMLVSTLFSFNNTDNSIIEAAKIDGANKIRLLTKIVMPVSSVEILNGLRICVANSFIAVVAADMLGATKGLGYMIVWSANIFHYAEMYIYILIVAFIGLVTNFALEKIIIFTKRRVFYESKNKRSIGNGVGIDNCIVDDGLPEREGGRERSCSYGISEDRGNDSCNRNEESYCG